MTEKMDEEQIGRNRPTPVPDDSDNPGADGVRNLTAFEHVPATRATDTMAVSAGVAR